MADKKVVLSLRNISKQYPGVQALDNVSIDFMEGEVHCLVGENGAGKSTFIKMISGADQPDSGVISFEGKEYNAMTPKLSKDLGIEVVYQEFNLAEDLTVAENMYLGEQHADSKLFNLKKLKKRADEVFKKMNIEIDTGEIVKYLTVSYMQFVEIGKALAKDIKVLILDEPTSQLDPIAASDFLGTVKKINRDLGTTILLTEHRLEEVFPAADRVVVMEGGEVLCMGTPEEIGEELKKQNHEMFLAMPVPMQIYAKVNSGKHRECPITVRDGRNWLNAICKEKQIRPQEAEFFGKDAKEKLAKEEIILEAKDIWFRYDKDQPDVVKGLNLSLKRGEFFALLGGNGTGKSTTLSIISRLRKPYRGKVLLEGKDIRRYSEKELFRGFLGVLPQNPQSLFVKKTVELELFEMVGGTKEKKNEEYVREVLSHDKCCLNMGKFTDSITFKCRESVNLCVRY